MADPSGFPGFGGCPVAARITDFQHAVAIGARENIVFIGRRRTGPLTRHGFAFFVEENQVIAEPGMQFGEVCRDHLQFCVVPRSRANTILGMFRLPIGADFDAEIRVPGFSSRTDRSCQILAFLIRSGESAQVCRHALRARNEEAHGRRSATGAARASARPARSHSAISGRTARAFPATAAHARAAAGAAAGTTTAAAARGVVRRRGFVASGNGERDGGSENGPNWRKQFHR